MTDEEVMAYATALAKQNIIVDGHVDPSLSHGSEGLHAQEKGGRRVRGDRGQL